jgi:molybdate transport system substrate-binding protein
MHVRRGLLALIVILLVVAAGAAALTHGGDSSKTLTVSAAKSLRNVLPAVADARYAFAGSNALQRQIERGARVDVFASAGPKEAQALFREGRCRRPVTFATNALVLLVPRDNRGHVRSLDSLRRGGLRLAVGAAGVPVGDYTRILLRRAGLSSVLGGNAVSQEPDVGGVTAKVALGSADAGVVYHTDALTARGRTTEIRLPAAVQPDVAYQACVVRRDGVNARGAEAFVARLRSAAGRRKLAHFGFGLPPRR